jgi:cyclopropane-fatty-acyl-phospholipid synthase
VKRLEVNQQAALGKIDKASYRVWRLYMAACALDFESGTIGMYQILASKPNCGQ